MIDQLVTYLPAAAQPYAVPTIGVIVIGLGIKSLGWFIPGFVANKVHELFNNAKANAWWREPTKPYRAQLLVATAKFLEQEIPNPGEGKELYANLGADIAGSTVLLAGTGSKWADVLEKTGDAVDLQLSQEIKDLAQSPS